MAEPMYMLNVRRQISKVTKLFLRVDHWTNNQLLDNYLLTGKRRTYVLWIVPVVWSIPSHYTRL